MPGRLTVEESGKDYVTRSFKFFCHKGNLETIPNLFVLPVNLEEREGEGGKEMERKREREIKDRNTVVIISNSRPLFNVATLLALFAIIHHVGWQPCARNRENFSEAELS